ncbi:hypothetical protein [Lysobacter gummosus]
MNPRYDRTILEAPTPIASQENKAGRTEFSRPYRFCLQRPRKPLPHPAD